MNCKELGYKLGDDFEMIERYGPFEKGDKVTLCEDDGTNRPRFSNGKTEQWVYLDKVKPLTMSMKAAYSVMAKNCGIKVGDTVKVLRRFENEENGCNPHHVLNMDRYVGEEGVVTEVDEDYWSYRVDFKTDDFYYPFFVLEKVKDAEESIIIDGHIVEFKEKGKIKVGCQKIDFETIKKIYDRAKATL